MNRQIGFYALCAAAMLLLPAAVSAGYPANAPEQAPAGRLAESYRVLDSQTGEIREVPVRDYLIGAVGAEMPASFAPEALKAQTVACHTYAERIRRMHEAAPDPALGGADFSDDPNVYQAFFTEDALRRFYGSSFEESYARIAEAVDAVSDQILCYADEPIVAAFHAISSGETDSAENVWGNALPYLIPVSSDADRSAPQYAETVTFPAETVRRTLEAENPQCRLPEDPSEWFSEPECSPSGTVLRLTAGDQAWSGQQLRQMFALRSACFSVEYTDGVFRFETKGFGHDVGMSQYGADAMARQGSSYAEILAHYYPGTDLSRQGRQPFPSGAVSRSIPDTSLLRH